MIVRATGSKPRSRRLAPNAELQALEDGFRRLRAIGVHSRHVQHLVERWHAEEVSAGTFKNRMSVLRCGHEGEQITAVHSGR